MSIYLYVNALCYCNTPLWINTGLSCSGPVTQKSELSFPGLKSGCLKVIFLRCLRGWGPLTALSNLYKLLMSLASCPPLWQSQQSTPSGPFWLTLVFISLLDYPPLSVLLFKIPLFHCFCDTHAHVHKWRSEGVLWEFILSFLSCRVLACSSTSWAILPTHPIAPSRIPMVITPYRTHSYL